MGRPFFAPRTEYQGSGADLSMTAGAGRPRSIGGGNHVHKCYLFGYHNQGRAFG